MDSNAKIYVAGHCGLAGSAIVRSLRAAGYGNIVCRTHAELDLTNQKSVRDFFSTERPEYVFISAAKVGGIYANSHYPGDFVFQNLAIQTNIIHESWKVGVKRLLFLGSSCIYPRECPQPMKEGYLLTGPLEPTNRPYAVAKIAGIEMCWAFNRQYGTSYIAVMPTNLYGPGDNYDLQTSHVLPALIRKMHEAKVRGDKEVAVWGSGTPRREFLFSSDLGDACVFLANLPDDKYSSLLTSDNPPLINVGCGNDLSIWELANLVAQITGFNGRLVLDETKPDGAPRKLLDIAKMTALGWGPKTALQDGIALAYREFVARENDGGIK